MNVKYFIVSFLVGLFAILAEAKVNDGVVNSITQNEYQSLVHDYESDANSWKYKGEKNSIIEFSATWCGPCKRLAPILDELAKEYSGKITFYKVDIDSCRELAQVYGVSSVPTILFCPADGSRPTVITGTYPKEEIIKVIEYVFKQ